MLNRMLTASTVVGIAFFLLGFSFLGGLFVLPLFIRIGYLELRSPGPHTGFMIGVVSTLGFVSFIMGMLICGIICIFLICLRLKIGIYQEERRLSRETS